MKIRLIIVCITTGLIIAGCSDVRRDPGRVYMPDMGYSRAYETYTELDSTKFTQDINAGGKIFYNHMPVAGAISRGEEMPFLLAMDFPGDSANYVASKQVVNPLTPDSNQLKEAERLYLVYCGICHGPKLDGNGPLYNGGNGPYPSAPANFIDPNYQSGRIFNMPEGQMFYTATYGKNMMGSYASQLTRTQRWMVIAYIKSKQVASGASKAAAGSVTDSTSATTTK